MLKIVQFLYNLSYTSCKM